MLKQRSISQRLRKEIRKSGLLLYDAFNKFDYDKNGFLSPGELWGALDYLDIHLTAYDVVEFINAVDLDKDGNISYKEFVDCLQDPDQDTTKAVVDEEEEFKDDDVDEFRFFDFGLDYNLFN